MKLTTIASICAAAVLVAVPATAHDGHADGAPALTRGATTAKIGGGNISTYVTMSKDKDNTGHRPPLEVGLEVPSAVMKSLPAEDTAAIVDFPIQARETPFQYMMVDWNPHGHEPAGVYDKPHFDFHFYIQDLEDVSQILPGTCAGLDCNVYAIARRPVPTPYAPAGYIDVGSVVPFMGNHLIDPASPEFNGQPFTRTWLYGAYDGKITFYEPMITLDDLTKQPNQCTALKLPQEYSDSGYYPTKYCTSFDAAKDVYRVSLKEFVYRTAPRLHTRGGGR